MAKVPEQVHGGFRENRHYQAYEELADETGMGRDTLRQTEPLYPSSMLTEGHSTMMNAWGARGSKENYKTSKWAKD